MEPELFPLVRSLRKKGYLFCAASGRTYESLLDLFAPVSEEIIFVVENGARAYAHGELLYQISLPEPLCRELTADIHAQPDCEARINIADKIYRVAKNDLVADFLDLPGVQAMIPVRTWEKISGPVTKISAFSPAGIERAASVLLPKWCRRVHANVTGTRWLDFSAVSKDFGLRKICEEYKISPENTIAFGDSFNDISMLNFAAHAYMMESACTELKELFPKHCVSVTKELRRINETEGV